jgi:cytochrome oxidase Cu insertion factor (SCO1/SenC/PrrC family)
MSDESATPAAAAPRKMSAREIWLLTAAAIGFMAAASMIAGKLFDATAPERPLPEMRSVKGDLEATERSGRTVRFSSLKGKVVVCAYIYTVCPHGCAAVMEEMKKLNEELGKTGEFHQVNISVIPERDTAEMLDGYAQALGLTQDDPWWFLTGAKDSLWNFMTAGLGLEEAEPIPEEERINPLDLYAHDLRVVLIDRKGMVRGYYSVFHPQQEIAEIMRKNLNADARRLVNNPDA